MSRENALLKDYKEHLKAMVLKSKWKLEKELSKSKVEDWWRNLSERQQSAFRREWLKHMKSQSTPHSPRWTALVAHSYCIQFVRLRPCKTAFHPHFSTVK